MYILRKFRKKEKGKYPFRFIQGIDYTEVEHSQYKYQMIRDRMAWTDIKGYEVYTEYFDLYNDGRLVIFSGYAWDGVTSFPDLPSMMRASCVHDVFFQILRESLIPDFDRDVFFKISNNELSRLSKIDGLPWPLYHLAKKAVDIFGYKYARKNIKGHKNV